VIAYEIVRRYGLAAERRRVAAEANLAFARPARHRRPAARPAAARRALGPAGVAPSEAR